MEATTAPATTSARTPLADPQSDDQCVLLTIVSGEGITHQPAHERVVAEYRSNQYLDALELARSLRVATYERRDGHVYTTDENDRGHYRPGTKCTQVVSYAIVVDRSSLEHYTSR